MSNNKIFKDQETEIREAEGAPKMMCQSDLLKLCLNAPSREGMSIDEMRRRIKALEAIEAKNPETQEIAFELDVFNELKRVVNNFKWALVHKDVVTTIDKINGL